MLDNKSEILAQKEDEQERKLSLRWLVAVSSIPLFGIVAAFGIAPDTSTENVEVQALVQQLPLPQATVASVAEDSFWRQERIQRGDTVGSVLSRLEVNDQDASHFLRSSSEAKALYQLIPGKSIRAETDAEGGLLSLRYLMPDGTLLQVSRGEDGFKVLEQQAQLETRVTMKSGEIRNSLFGATDAAGVPDAIAMQIAEMFSTDIDFHQDLRKGDRFAVVYETLYSEGEYVRTGRVLAAEFTNQGKTYKAVWFQDETGRGGYYTPDGKALRKAFLRSPLEFSRISSGFTRARFHPVLKTWRAHKGVDYAAPTGTRVKTVADGTVTFVGKKGGYGNVVVVQHGGKNSTLYAHLSGFAKGLRTGARVNQGDVIGYVGSTGVATGPHLHFEFKVAGVQQDPLKVNVPTAYPIAAKQMPKFRQIAEPLVARLEMMQVTNLASLD